MVQFPAHLAKGSLQHAEIDEHSARVKDVAARMREHPVIVPVKAFAFPVKIGEKMSCRKIGFNPYFKHDSRIPKIAHSGNTAAIPERSLWDIAFASRD